MCLDARVKSITDAGDCLVLDTFKKTFHTVIRWDYGKFIVEKKTA